MTSISGSVGRGGLNKHQDVITVQTLLNKNKGISCADTPALASTSLCQSDEKVVFSCTVQSGKKIVSLCSSPNLTENEGYLQYRFGRPGAVELEFPAQRSETQKMFRYAHYFRYQVDRTNISFDNHGYTYTVFENYEGDVQPEIRQQGVQVAPSKATQKSTTLSCAGEVISNLNSLISIVPCDKNDPLNMDECQ